VNESANIDNMSDIQCIFKRLSTRTVYAPLASRYVACVSASVCGILSLFLGIWWRADFVIFPLFSDVYLNLLNY